MPPPAAASGGPSKPAAAGGAEVMRTRFVLRGGVRLDVAELPSTQYGAFVWGCSVALAAYVWGGGAGRCVQAVSRRRCRRRHGWVVRRTLRRTGRWLARPDVLGGGGGTSVLELGCGAGVAGLACAACPWASPRRVVLTDDAEERAWERSLAETLAANPGVLGRAGGPLVVRQALPWGSVAAAVEAAARYPEVRVLLAADCMFAREVADPFCSTLALLLERLGRGRPSRRRRPFCLVAHQLRDLDQHVGLHLAKWGLVASRLPVDVSAVVARNVVEGKVAADIGEVVLWKVTLGASDAGCVDGGER